ncbi:MAG: hypothetical protein Q4E43_06885 [Akkermansia sp.]|nr:hypothetical protein [Akkermansia sp.]
MKTTKQLQRIFIDNWKPKLVCLVVAVLVWLLINRIVEQEETPVWEIDEVLTSQPE